MSNTINPDLSPTASTQTGEQPTPNVNKLEKSPDELKEMIEKFEQLKELNQPEHFKQAEQLMKQVEQQNKEAELRNIEASRRRAVTDKIGY